MPDLADSGSQAVAAPLRGFDTTPTYSLHARTFRISQLIGSRVLHWTVDLAARAAAILATAPQSFIPFRELMSARGHALLQLFLPVDHDNHALSLRRRFRRFLDHQKTLAVARDVISAKVEAECCGTQADPSWRRVFGGQRRSGFPCARRGPP